MLNSVPHEVVINGVYFSPLLLVFVISFAATLITVGVLNKLKLSQYIIHIPLGFLSIMTLYMILIDTFFIKF